MQTTKTRRRLLILDVDNTLLHVPVYSHVLHAIAGDGLSEEEFYSKLPDSGIPVDDDPFLKVYPRPYLTEFLDKAQNLGYDLALCTTGTREYIDTVLPLCGVSVDRFVSILTREQLKSRGVRTVKDIRPFSSLGYEEEKIVAIDDRKEVYIQPDHVLKIPPFDVNDDSFQGDNELLVMAERLEHLGGDSLVEARQLQRFEREREGLFLDLAYAAFDSNKYRELPFWPDFFLRPSFDLEQFPECENLEALSLDKFLIYKDYGLVGAAEKKDDYLLINNYCPKIWVEVPAGVSRIGGSVQEITDLFWYMDISDLVAKCESMGYSVPEENHLALAAVTLQKTHFGGFHVLALCTGLIESNPMFYE